MCSLYRALQESAENSEQEAPVSMDTDSESPLSSVPMPTSD